MPQCKAEHEVRGEIWYCVHEADELGHKPHWPHIDDEGRMWDEAGAKVKIPVPTRGSSES